MKLNEHFRQIKPPKLFHYFKNSKSRLLIFNYENTLQDIDESQNIDNNDFLNKKKLKRIVKIISALCEDPKNMVFIISRYDHTFLFKILEKSIIWEYVEKMDFFINIQIKKNLFN
jgi:trehalose-6-phosphatase